MAGNPLNGSDPSGLDPRSYEHLSMIGGQKAGCDLASGPGGPSSGNGVANSNSGFNLLDIPAEHHAEVVAAGAASIGWGGVIIVTTVAVGAPVVVVAGAVVIGGAAIAAGGYLIWQGLTGNW